MIYKTLEGLLFDILCDAASFMFTMDACNCFFPSFLFSSTFFVSSGKYLSSNTLFALFCRSTREMMMGIPSLLLVGRDCIWKEKTEKMLMPCWRGARGGELTCTHDCHFSSFFLKKKLFVLFEISISEVPLTLLDCGASCWVVQLGSLNLDHLLWTERYVPSFP